MARFKRERPTILLTFESPDLAGLEVRVRSISVGKLIGLVDMAGALRIRGDEPTSDQQDDIETLLRAFASALVSWNLDDENDQPVPTTYESLIDQDTNFVLQLVMGWLDGVVSIPNPLDGRSNAGERSPAGEASELSIPMEPLSTSPLS